MKKTKFYNNVESKWILIDARNEILGRLAVRISRILQGKNKAVYSPNFLCGDHVVVINVEHVRVTGNKLKAKVYDKYSGYPSGRKEIVFDKLIKKNSVKSLYLAVKGMLPKNVLAKRMLRNLRIYPQEEHPHTAQNPLKGVQNGNN